MQRFRRWLALEKDFSLMASLSIIDFSHMTAYEMTQGLLFITTHHRVGQRN